LIRPATSADCDAVARIYNHYIEHTVVTFEEEPVAPDDMAARMREVTSAALPWLVTEHHGEVVGYAYAARWKSRSAYRFSVESTVYLAPTATGQGLGRSLYEHLLALLQQATTHMVMGGIALPNAASVALHESLGFEKVAHFKEVGFKQQRWVDVGYWQRAL